MDFTQLVVTFGYWAVLVFVGIQCTGIPFPGGAVLLATAVYGGVTHQLAVLPIILAASAGVILGSMLGFWLGSRQGYRFVLRYSHFLRLDERKLKLGQYLFLKYGGIIVLLGRFISVTRTWAALLAGINKMEWTRFLQLNVAGGVLWATVIGLGAYYLGDSWQRSTRPISISLLVLVLCLVMVGLFFLTRYVRTLEDEAGRAFPGPFELYAGETKPDSEQSQ